jgi:hypothetical protein
MVLCLTKITDTAPSPLETRALGFAPVAVIRAWHAVDIYGAVKKISRGEDLIAAEACHRAYSRATWPNRRCRHGHSGDLGYATPWLVTAR